MCILYLVNVTVQGRDVYTIQTSVNDLRLRFLMGREASGMHAPPDCPI